MVEAIQATYDAAERTPLAEQSLNQQRPTSNPSSQRGGGAPGAGLGNMPSPVPPNRHQTIDVEMGAGSAQVKPSPVKLGRIGSLAQSLSMARRLEPLETLVLPQRQASWG